METAILFERNFTDRVEVSDDVKDAIFNFACTWTPEYVEKAEKMQLEEEFYIFFENVAGMTYDRMKAFQVVWRVFNETVNGTGAGEEDASAYMEEFIVGSIFNAGNTTSDGIFLSMTTNMLIKIGELAG